MKISRFSPAGVRQILVIAVCFIVSALMIRNTVVNGPPFFSPIPAKLPVRRGMSIEEVRTILGEPGNVITTKDPDGESREDWWYTKPYQLQLTFIDGRLTSDHSKALTD